MAIEYFLPGALLVQSNLSGSIDQIKDNPDNPDNLWLTALSIADIELRVGFSKPTTTLLEGDGLQSFNLWLRRTDNSARIPLATVELYEDGTFVETLSSDISVNETTGELHTFAWDASLISNISGEKVEIRVTATKTDGPENEQNTIEIGAIEWMAKLSEWTHKEQGSASWMEVDQNSNLWDIAFNDTDQWSIRNAREITNVEIEYETAADTSISWNVLTGTIGITLNRPEITGGVEPFTFEWRQKSGSGLMNHEGTDGESLTLSYTSGKT